MIDISFLGFPKNEAHWDMTQALLREALLAIFVVTAKLKSIFVFFCHIPRFMQIVCRFCPSFLTFWVHEQMAHTDGAELVAIKIAPCPELGAKVGVYHPDALFGDMVVDGDQRAKVIVVLTLIRLI